jgi:hypothetical protein
MPDIYEKDLDSKTTLETSDYVRIVGDDNVSYKNRVADIAETVITDYDSQTLAGSQQTVKEAIDFLQNKTNNIYSPHIAHTVSEMTNQDLIYIYVGNETGYTNGNWYYYDGGTWVSGGVYNAVAVNTDTTLSIAGRAADAKATGDAIDGLDDDITDLKSALDTFENSICDIETPFLTNFLIPVVESGYYDVSTGAKVGGSGWIRTPNAIELPLGFDDLKFVANNTTLGATVFFYSGEETNTYISYSNLASIPSTPVGISIPASARYVRLYMNSSLDINDLAMFVGENHGYEEYHLNYTIKESVLPETLLDDVENGVTAYEEFSTILTSLNILPPAQETGYFTGSVGGQISKVYNSGMVRTPEPVSFSSFTGEYTLRLKNAIAGGGYCQIFFLAADKSTIVFAQSFNSANVLYIRDYVPATAEYFVLWVNVGSDNFSISDVCVSTIYIETYFEYGTALTLNDYTNHEKVSKILNDSKNIVIFGDSIFGMVDTETSVANVMRQYTNAEIVNCAFGGTRLTIRSTTDGYQNFDFGNLVNCVASGDYSSLVATGLPSYYPARINRLSHVDFTKVDTVILFYGTNDYMSGVTEAGILACKSYINILQTACPQINVILCTPAYRCWFNEGSFDYDGNTYNPGGGTMADYYNYFDELAKSANIQLLDCYNIGINSAN